MSSLLQLQTQSTYSVSDCGLFTITQLLQWLQDVICMHWSSYVFNHRLQCLCKYEQYFFVVIH